MVVKVNLHKAYGSVNWSFLVETLEGFGFPKNLIDLIAFSLKESDISILWNGGRLHSFVPGQGLRQGDPLAPYLFNLVMERLAHDIQAEVTKGSWKPIHIMRGGLGVSHLFFADDLMLFGEASIHKATVISNYLNRFSCAFGLKVNLFKSQVYYSANMNAGLTKTIGDKLGMPITSQLDSYLGIPMLQRQVSKDMFATVIDKMRAKLAMWKESSLNMAGRRILVQSSFATVPTYTMQAMALPISCCKDINRICRNFLWGHEDSTQKIHTINWSEVCKPRQRGGLGLRKAKDINLAFLTKQVCCTNGRSWGWRSIMKGKVVKRYYGPGQSGRGYRFTLVKEFITDGNTWNIPTMEELLPNDWISRIKAVILPVDNNQDDSLYWPHSGHENEEDASHAWVWRINYARKIKLLLWKSLKDGEEFLDHMFRQCDITKVCRRFSNPPSRFNSSNHLPLRLWLETFCTGSRDGHKLSYWNLLFPHILWNIWKGRNNRVFNRVSWTPDFTPDFKLEQAKSLTYCFRATPPPIHTGRSLVHTVGRRLKPERRERESDSHGQARRSAQAPPYVVASLCSSDGEEEAGEEGATPPPLLPSPRLCRRRLQPLSLLPSSRKREYRRVEV
ncbi:uncharacterized protein LOC116015710 [Ipomoea triloba]|uniref:uncharacterized protein LOC116015710 n=1 Tax=Ipomoea triloba TaxID=35885 RepID=UPI00125E06C0|nr:uncharacterized protein LOC116015710 [Ipomoea triloba]